MEKGTGHPKLAGDKPGGQLKATLNARILLREVRLLSIIYVPAQPNRVPRSGATWAPRGRPRSEVAPLPSPPAARMLCSMHIIARTKMYKVTVFQIKKKSHHQMHHAFGFTPPNATEPFNMVRRDLSAETSLFPSANVSLLRILHFVFAGKQRGSGFILLPFPSNSSLSFRQRGLLGARSPWLRANL